MTGARGSGVSALLRDYSEFAGRRLWLALGLMLLAALAEGLGILMLVPLASVAIGEDTAGILAPARDLVPTFGADQRFALALALFVGAMALRSALTFARDLQLARLQSGYEASLRLRSAATLAQRGWPFAAR